MIGSQPKTAEIGLWCQEIGPVVPEEILVHPENDPFSTPLGLQKVFGKTFLQGVNALMLPVNDYINKMIAGRQNIFEKKVLVVPPLGDIAPGLRSLQREPPHP